MLLALQSSAAEDAIAPVFIERFDKTKRETLTVTTEISQEQKLRCWPQRHLSGHICGMD